MKKIFLLLFVTVYVLTLKAQQVLKPAILPFTKIEVYGSFDVEFSKTDKESVQLESETVDLSKISVIVKKGTLKIRSMQKLFEQEKQVRIIIGYKTLEEVLLSNGASLYCSSNMNFNKLHIIQGNGAKAEFKANIISLIADIDKGAILNLEGNCQMADVEVSTGAIFNAYEFVCDSIVVRANASGLAKINVAKYLDARASTGGDVSYRGIPKVFKQRTIMGGTIEKVIEYNSSLTQ
jgi:hypothetical protein